MALTPAKCQAARALLGWKQKELADRAKTNVKTVLRYEKGEELRERTVADIQRALEEAGATFLDPEERVHEGGVVLRWGSQGVVKDNTPQADDAERDDGQT